MLDGAVGNWFGTMFLAIGAISLFAAALGIVDYVSRLVADVIHTGYTRGSGRWSESRMYFGARVDDGALRLRDPADGLRPAARAGDDLDRPAAARS